jgi:hypothetical protein
MLALLACTAGTGCGADEDLAPVAEPPPVSAALTPEEVAPEDWSADGPSILCMADAWSTVFYAGADHRALVDLSLVRDEATARHAIADAPALLDFPAGAEGERPADGPGDERVTITDDGVVAVVWRRERFVAVVLVQDATSPAPRRAPRRRGRRRRPRSWQRRMRGSRRRWPGRSAPQKERARR